MTREDFIRAVEARRQFANQHNIDAYVLILDMNAVTMPVMDVRLARWSTYVDHRMQHVFIVGTPPVVQAVANVLARLSRVKIEFVETLAEGMKLARARLHARTD